MNSPNNITESKLLSIVIPVYNSKKHLSKCVDSILAMNRIGIEIILVDDGSTDGSTELCQLYQKRYSLIKTLRQKNQGPSSARNRGLEQAVGKYVAFFDSDDYVSPSELKNTLTYLEEYPEADLWISDFFRVADNGFVLDQIQQIVDTSKPMQGREYLSQFLRKKGCVWNVWRYFFRRRFLLQNKMYFVESVRCAEDLEYTVCAMTKAESIVFFHNPYYFYRVNYGDTLTRWYTKKRVQELSDMLQQSIRYLQKDLSETARLLSDKIILEYILNLALLEEVPVGERPEVHDFLQSTSWIMSSSERRDIKLIGLALSLFGINTFSKVLYFFKCVKRKLREKRSASNSGNEGD